MAAATGNDIETTMAQLQTHLAQDSPVANYKTSITSLAHCKLPICTLNQQFCMDRYGGHGSVTEVAGKLGKNFSAK